MGSSNPPSFGEAFGLHHALHLAVNTAFRSGAPLCPETLIEILMAQFPASGLTEDQVREAIVEAAKEAGVTIREASTLQHLVASRSSGSSAGGSEPRA